MITIGIILIVLIAVASLALKNGLHGGFVGKVSPGEQKNSAAGVQGLLNEARLDAKELYDLKAHVGDTRQRLNLME